MKFLYNYNGLPFYTKEDILLRNHFISMIESKVTDIFRNQNNAWHFIQIEAPSLIPRDLVSANYTEDDVYFIDDKLALKPETTASSYLYLEHILKSNLVKLPVSVFQASQSFRKEQDQVTKHCRFKGFYQLEFQCLYSADTKNDYQENTINELADMIASLVKLPTRIVLSDRLPSYSLKTIDIEVYNGDKWMEVSSISLRNDFTYKPIMKNKEVPCLVLEIAIGLDRLIYNCNVSTNQVSDLREVVCL